MSGKSSSDKKKSGVKSLLITILVAAAVIGVCFFSPIDTLISSQINKGRTADYSQGDLQVETTNYTGYYYSLLTDKEKQACDIIVSQIGAMPDSIIIPRLDSSQLSAVFDALSYDYPEFFFLDNDCSATNFGIFSIFYPTYSLTEEEYQSQLSELRTLKEQFFTEYSLENCSDYEKVLKIHDYLAKYIEYHDGDQSDMTPYGVLAKHTGGCEGYARTAQYLLDAAGVKNHLVPGTAVGGENESAVAHMWNVVYIDGKAYNMDVTFDDYVIANAGDASFSPEASHTYFLKSTEQLSKTHTPESESMTEDCTNTDIDYFALNGTKFDTYDEAKAALPGLIRKAASNGTDSVEFKFTSSEAFYTAKSRLFDRGAIDEVLNSAGVNIDSISYISDSNYNVIRIYF